MNYSETRSTSMDLLDTQLHWRNCLAFVGVLYCTWGNLHTGRLH